MLWCSDLYSSGIQGHPRGLLKHPLPPEMVIRPVVVRLRDTYFNMNLMQVAGSVLYRKLEHCSKHDDVG